jgi:hypothetical protein
LGNQDVVFFYIRLGAIIIDHCMDELSELKVAFLGYLKMHAFDDASILR